MVNFFKSFRKFHEAEKPAPDYFATIKKQQRIPKKLWFGMPFMIEADKEIELDGKKFHGPMAFYVKEFDSGTVTLQLVRNPIDFTDGDDPDDEIDLDNNNDGETQIFTIPRSVFEKLLEPSNFQGADYSTASQNALAPR